MLNPLWLRFSSLLLTPISNSAARATTIVCKQFNPAVWVNACEFQVTLAASWTANWSVSCGQLRIHGILW